MLPMGWRLPRGFGLIVAGGLSVACGRTPLDVEGSYYDGFRGAGGAMSGGVSGSASAAAGGRAGPSSSGGASGGYFGSGGAFGDAGVTASTGGQRAESRPDRCAHPGPPPAWGAADGSEYEFGDVLEVAHHYYDRLAVADLNGDGRPDLIASDYFLPVISFLQLSPGVFDDGTEAPDSLTSGFGPSHGMHVATFWGAAPEVIVARGLQHGLSVFLNDGSGRLASTETIEGYSLSTPTTWDIDGDGDLDALALANDETYISKPSQLVIHENDGRRLVFGRAVDVPFRGSDLRVADVTGDGKPEVLVMRESPARVAVLQQSSFNELTLLDEIVAAGSMQLGSTWYQVGDIDGDAANDVVMVEDEWEPDIERVWIAHQRDGALEPAQPIDTLPKNAGNIAGGSIAITDINLDELNDIVITSSAFNMVAYLQKADHSFRRIQKDYPTAGSIIESAIAVGDLDCDGCPDVAGMQVDRIRVFTGRGCAR
jgi:hypothetical protein